MASKFSEKSALERMRKDLRYLRRQHEEMKADISMKMQAARELNRHARHTQHLIDDYEEVIRKLQG
jgi:3-hydroxyisobutyrate dehydrogenase-like beta-hydroxyacid dehydrogenase